MAPMSGKLCAFLIATRLWTLIFSLKMLWDSLTTLNGRSMKRICICNEQSNKINRLSRLKQLHSLMSWWRTLRNHHMQNVKA